MNKLLLSLFTCLVFAQSMIQADQECQCLGEVGTIEARASYFLPSSKTLRDMLHGGGGVDWALETTIPIGYGLQVWSAVDYFSKGGKMIGSDRSVHLMMVPVTLGLKYLYRFNRHYGVYGGVGGKYYFVEMVNRTQSIYRTTNRNGLGGVAEVGNLFIIGRHFVFDLFASWSYKKISGLHHLPPNAHSIDVQVGGWNFGGGIGYAW